MTASDSMEERIDEILREVVLTPALRTEEDEALISEAKSALLRLIAEAIEDTIFKIMSPKTEGLFDNGDLFIKRKPIEDAVISMIGYEKYKAMQEAVDALSPPRREEQA